MYIRAKFHVSGSILNLPDNDLELVSKKKYNRPVLHTLKALYIFNIYKILFIQYVWFYTFNLYQFLL